ncbi:MAG: DUF748 domain-containing protein [Desulfobulbaceae bacterium]|nr:DUF748 domain-containing protein [Desulfobulbaceae bacterium]
MPDPDKKGLPARFRALTLPVKVAGVGALLLFLYTLVGFLVVPLVAKKVLEKKLPVLLHRAVAIGKITFNPYTLALAVDNFHLAQKEGAGDLFAFDRLFVDLEGVSLLKRALIIKAVSLSGPRIEFSHLEAQTYSFSDLLTADQEPKAAPAEKSRPFQFAIQNIEVKDGRLLFHDLPKKTDHTVTGLYLGVPTLSNLPYQVETYVQPAFAAVINGTPFAIGGQSKPFAKSLDTEVELKAQGINVPEYLAYIPNPTGLVLQSARLDIDARLHLLARPDNTYRLALIGRVALRELAVADKAGKTYLQIPELALTLADSDLLAQEVHLSEVSLQAPAVTLERLSDGRLQPLALLALAEPSSGPAGVAAHPAKAAPVTGSALKLEIDKVRLSEGRVEFRDAAAGFTVATRLDIDTSVRLLPQADNSARLALLGRVSLRDLALSDQKGKAYLKLPELALTLAEANLLAQEVHLSDLTLTAPVVNLERLADGRLLPLAWLTTPVNPPALAEEAQPDNAAPPQGPALKLNIDKMALNNGRVDFRDAAVGPGQEPAHLSLRDLSLQVAALSNAPAVLANLSLVGKINEAARLQVKGQLGLEPVQSNLHLQLTELALKPFQPYISQQARLVIAGGKLALSGDLALSPKSGGGLQSDFQGEAALANLATVDTVFGEDLLKWRYLGLKKIHFASDPGQLAVAAIDLTDPYLKVLFGPDGVLNLRTITPTPAAAPAPATTQPVPAAAAAQPFATNIGSITINGGRLDFVDRQVSPAYGTSLSELHGSISDLSSLTASSAAVDFSAKLDQQAPLKITGRINPLSTELLVDLKVDFADINLSPMSPYSGKFIGYKVDKGKLNLDLKYDIKGRQLESQNRAFIDQFTLGETVASPEATNLPVRLALSLLRDRKGVISFDVPVSGSLDDPDFSVFRIVIKVLVNLIAKAATSPAALLGALIPAGQDIQFIPFLPGSAAISPEAAIQLTTVEKVLFERPALKMDLLGKVDPASDAEALARLRLTTSVKLQKLLASGKAGKEAEAQVEEVALSAEEYPAFLALAYQAARKPTPGGKAAEGAPPTVASMENYLLTTITVGEDELRLLALARANQLLSTLMAGGKVEAGRLFVVEPKVSTAGAGTAQVELVIK